MDASPLDANPLDATQVDLNKLRTFFVIAEEGGVSAAARRLALTRSAISHSLSALEGDLGVSLFHRVGKRLLLTRDGQRLRAAYRTAEATIGQALEAIGHERVEVRGSVRLGLFLGALRFPVSATLSRFLSEHPRAQVRVTYGSQGELRQQLLAGRLDFSLAVRSSGSGDARLRSTRLAEQTLVLAARDRAGRAGDFDTLSNLPFVDYFRSEPVVDRWFRHHFPRHKKRASNIRAWAASTDLALDLTRRGVGACVLPHELVEPLRRVGELVVLKGGKPPLRDGLWLDELEGARGNLSRSALRAALLAGLG